jgi:hypothetical protein
MTTREFMAEGFDGYEEFPKCINIDGCSDIVTMFTICLKFFELVNTLKKDEFNSGINKFEPGSFGFDTNCENIFNYMKKVVVYQNGKPEVVINLGSRINII